LDHKTAGGGSWVLPPASFALRKFQISDRRVMIDEPAMMNPNSRCPRCGAGRLQSWSELGQEEREIVRRLPASADYNLEERKARHRWCVRCWYEEVSGAADLA